MDKEDLNRLISSGKYLCFKPNMMQPRSDPDSGGAETAAETSAETGGGMGGEQAAAAEPRAELFDLALLQQSIYFKETAADEDGDIRTDTRVMLAFDEHDPLQGGISSSAKPSILIPALEKWYGGAGKITLSDHDMQVLEVLARAPTFDPFILMSYRADLEQQRTVHPAYFEVDQATSNGVRRVIESRAARLVKLALAMDDAVDLDTPDADGADAQTPSPFGPDEALLSRQRSITASLAKAIWTTRLDQQSKELLAGFRIAEGDMARVLFAWKGISYYEFLFRGLINEHKDFFRWLGADDSLPRDKHQMRPGEWETMVEQRKNAVTAIRQSYLRCANVLKRYDEAYAALTDKQDPKPFQRFLMAAPGLFQGLGMSIGRFGHAGKAWSDLTNQGRRMRLGASKLEPFYAFVLSLGRPAD